MTKNPAQHLALLFARRERAFGTWLKANARLSLALNRLEQYCTAKREALVAQGISPRQLGEFRRWNGGASKPTDCRTITRYVRCRMVIHTIDEKWDPQITATQVEVDQARADLAAATIELLAVMPVALAGELTGLSTRRLCAIARACQNNFCPPTRGRSNATDDFPT
jgi:hypothetical protein